MKQNKKEPVPETPSNEKKENESAPGEELPLDGSPRKPATSESEKPPTRIKRSLPNQAASVEILQDVIGLITRPEIGPEAGARAARQRELNEVVHSMLVLGLGLSTAVMCMGIALTLYFHTPPPSAVSPFKQVVRGLDRLTPTSFLSLGILLLIATPILRVFGSLIEFLITRDWPYAAITLLVAIILSISILAGRG